MVPENVHIPSYFQVIGKIYHSTICIHDRKVNIAKRKNDIDE